MDMVEIEVQQPAEPRSPSPEGVLEEYIQLKFKENLTPMDFPEEGMQNLTQLPLFQAIQVVHRFNDSVGPRVVNRQAFLITIIRTTNRWWCPIDGSKIYMDGPNTSLIVNLCMSSTLSPDVFTPSVCHVLQLLNSEQITRISKDFSTHALAQAFSNDSYYAKQQLFLSMAQACLKKTTTSPLPTSFPQSFTSFRTARAPVPLPGAATEDMLELSASEAAELGRRREYSSAQCQLNGILSEFIARTCATSKGTIRESDIDNTARDALKRIALLQAMQALQHFANSLLVNRIQNRSAYLMGIIGGQEEHWGRSRAALVLPNGAQDLLNLHPRLVLKIAHLCLDGNCLPSDFSPEVCLELKRCMDFDSALNAVMSFNNNKRIIAGGQGGIRDRVGFFHSLVRNVNLQHPNHTVTVTITTEKSTSLELNPKAKPYSPLRPPPATTPSTAATLSVAIPPPSSPVILSQVAEPNHSPKAMVDDARLLESSREAIEYLTSSFARSRTSELRLRKELAESQAQVHSLFAQIQRMREDNLRHIEDARAQILVNVSRNFDSLLKGTLEPKSSATTTSSPIISSPSLSSVTGKDLYA
ncbi:hypothetical protein BASA81_001923 [Batrachochytrium salamandrivorans]|nr:hypothetical protein BASA81_001923 [Batrachochytrium salamandrivorans]